MRALFVAESVPWPSTGGGLVRVARNVASVASVADLDLIMFGEATSELPEWLVSKGVRRWTTVAHPAQANQMVARFRWAIRRGVPLEVAMVNSDRRPSETAGSWSRPPYDLVWFSTAASYEWLGRPRWGPTVVDLMDLEDVKALKRIALLAETQQGRTAAGRVRSKLAAAQTRINAWDWQRLQTAIARQTERVVVASEVDALRSGLPNVVAIPNTYPQPDHPAGNPSATRPPVVLFQGTLTYPPNIDGAHWLASEVAPRIKAHVPDVTIRLVGNPATSVRSLERPGEISVVGPVPVMVDELARATVAVVPVRFGSGTRIKILESFAHRVPVVSTTVGAEGLDVRDGVHLLLADDRDAFAAAVVRLLHQPDLRVRLTRAAEELYRQCYDGRVADDRLRLLVAEVASDNTRS